MVFWVLAGIGVVVAVGMIWWGHYEGYSASDIASSVGAVAGIWMVATLLALVVVGVAGFSNDVSSRVLSEVDLAPYEDGSYVEVRFMPDDTYYSFREQSPAGVYVPRTESGSDSYRLVVSSKTDAVIVEEQTYLDNPWLWPWILEGNSTTEIRVPEGSVILK